MQKINELQILTKGNVEIIGENYKLQLKEAKKYCDSIEIAKIGNNEDYKQGFKFSKDIKEGQDKIKDIITSLDNQEIIELKEKLIEINKILATKNTAIKKRLDEYKENEKDMIIENGFENIKSQEIYKADYEIYKKECLNQFKGKSKFEEMQTISLNIAETYQNKLEMQQLKYEKAFSELKKYCEEIALAETDYTIDLESKAIVLKGIDTTEAKARLHAKMELQQKAISDKLEAENTARIAAEAKARAEVEVVAEKPVEPTRSNITPPIETPEDMFCCNMTLEIITTKPKIEKLKQFLLENGINFIWKEAKA